ncbi:MAG: phosphate ABC transporter permease PstA [Clostridia bacterium]|nr:phosphate ABC transporter permease PstA [Clostridia bacterium]
MKAVISSAPDPSISSCTARERRQRRRRERTQIVMLITMGAGLVVTLGFLLLMLGFIGWRGLPVVNWAFLTQMPRRGMTEGGILPAILGTFWLTVGSMAVAGLLGVASAVYLAEYARQGFALRLIRTGVANLAGVPSVVFGLFGLAVFVKAMRLGVSILSGALTLAIVVLPTIIRSSEEAIMAVPGSYREASLALGATKWQTVRYAVLPSAFPGILTGFILSIARAMGETAPIMLTAATFFTASLPHSPFDEVQALAYHIFALVTEGTRPEAQTPMAFGTAVVLMAMVIGMNLIATSLRARYEKKRAR